MKKITMFLSLATAAVILSGCYVSPYYYHHGGYGVQCPPPIKVNVDVKEKKKEKKKTPECKPACKPTCEPVYKPTCVY